MHHPRGWLPFPPLRSLPCSSITSAFRQGRQWRRWRGSGAKIRAAGRTRWRRWRPGRLDHFGSTKTSIITEFYYSPLLKARSGERGRGKQCYGKAAPDQIYHVPVGTLIYRLPQKEIASDLAIEAGEGRTFIDFTKVPESDEALSAPAPAEIDPHELVLIADLTESGVDFVLKRAGKATSISKAAAIVRQFNTPRARKAKAARSISNCEKSPTPAWSVTRTPASRRC
jgi:hypothetical protein